MAGDAPQLVYKAWNYAHVLRDDRLSYMAYTEQITFLLFLKMAHLTKQPYKRAPIVPKPGLGQSAAARRRGARNAPTPRP